MLVRRNDNVYKRGIIGWLASSIIFPERGFLSTKIRITLSGVF